MLPLIDIFAYKKRTRVTSGLTRVIKLTKSFTIIIKQILHNLYILFDTLVENKTSSHGHIHLILLWGI